MLSGLVTLNYVSHKKTVGLIVTLKKQTELPLSLVFSCNCRNEERIDVITNRVSGVEVSCYASVNA